MILFPTKRRKTTSGPAEFQDSYPSSPTSFVTDEEPASPAQAAPQAVPPATAPAATERRETRSASVRPRQLSNSAVVRTPAPPSSTCPAPSSFTPCLLPSRPDEPAGVLVTEELGSPTGEESLTRSFRIVPPTRTFKSVCRDVAAKRIVRWLNNLPRYLANDWHKAAVLLQAIGEEQATACLRCAQGGGPFESCVALGEQIYKGACANCISTSHTRKCTFRPDYNPSEVLNGRSVTVVPPDAPNPSGNGPFGSSSRKRAASAMSLPSQAAPPLTPIPPVPSFHDDSSNAVLAEPQVEPEPAVTAEAPANIDTHLLNDINGHGTSRPATRRSTRLCRWSLGLPPEPQPQPEEDQGLVSRDTGPVDEQDNDTKVEEDGIVQQQQQNEHEHERQQQQQEQEQEQKHEQKVHYEVPRTFRKHKFIAFPDTLNPNEEAAIGTALAEARAICQRLEGRLRKLRRASWVEDSDG